MAIGVSYAWDEGEEGATKEKAANGGQRVVQIKIRNTSEEAKVRLHAGCAFAAMRAHRHICSPVPKHDARHRLVFMYFTSPSRAFGSIFLFPSCRGGWVRMCFVLSGWSVRRKRHISHWILD